MIIAISGKKQSGKNTVATIIQYLTHQDGQYKAQQAILRPFLEIIADPVWTKQLKKDHPWKEKSFAYELKLFISKIANIPMEWFEDEEKKNMLMPEEWGYYYLCSYKLKTNGNPTGRASNTYATLEEAQESLDKYKRAIEGLVIAYTVPTLREMMTGIGTDALRNFHPNIWINALFAGYKGEYTSSGRGVELAKELQQNWIVTDCRFPNELKACKDRKALTIRINRWIKEEISIEVATQLWREREIYGIDNNSEALIEEESQLKYFDRFAIQVEQSTHESETALDDAEFDYVIHNNHGIEELVGSVKMILEEEGIINGNQ